MSIASASFAPIQIEDLRARKMSLEQRLEDGDRRIRDAERQGRDVAAWEEFWLTLLNEYESICDEIQLAA